MKENRIPIGKKKENIKKSKLCLFTAKYDNVFTFNILYLLISVTNDRLNI